VALVESVAPARTVQSRLNPTESELFELVQYAAVIESDQIENFRPLFEIPSYRFLADLPLHFDLRLE